MDELDTLTSSIEDLSVGQKQLPRRQQVQKPVLKYNTDISKPVQLYNHGVTSLPLHKDGFSSSTSSLISNASITTPRKTLNHGAPPNTSVNATSLPNNTKNPASPPKPASNPYRRPLSAKDVPLPKNLQNHPSKMRKSPSISMMSNLPQGGLVREAPLIIQEEPKKPPNSFMRPTSAAHRESHLQRVQSAKKFRCKLADAIKVEPDLNDGEPKVDGQTSSREKADKKSITYKAAMSQASSEIKLQSDKKLNSQSLKPSPPDTKKPPSGQNDTAFEMLAKVRNLNYTPTKPYEDVNTVYNPSLNTAAILEYTNTPVKKTSTAGTPITNFTAPVIPVHRKNVKLTATTTLNSEINSEPLNKPPVHPRSTVFYRKGSKSEELIFEQRPKAEGALCSTPGTTDGKSLEMNSSKKRIDSVNEEDDKDGDEVEESEGGTPSGERLPGDGEASLEDDEEEGDDDEDLDEDDDGVDGLDDDVCVDSEGETDGLSITSSNRSRQSSGRPASVNIRARRPSNSKQILKSKSLSNITGGVYTRPALRPSLFPNIPPTINFISENERVEVLPWEIRKLLKWRMSPITPNIVKSALARVGFRVSKKNHDWLGCFGKHMKSQGFKAVKEYQKLNHFPGSFQIGRKDRLWRNLSRMQVHFGKREFGFFPQTYVLPQDLKLLKRAWEDGGSKQKWIIKPPASARGIGIKVIHKWAQIPRRKPVIVQRYLSRPYLINESKFDMRVYVYVSGYDPLRIYIYEDGLARFASCKYSSSMKSLNNKYMHLTNYSINKRNTEYQSNTDDTVCQGHKWSLKSLWSFLKKRGVNTTAIWDSIKDLAIKTIISSESPINSMIKANVKSRYCVHELFGFDVMLDENLKPWIIEVNISPSLHSNSQLDVNIKGQMIKDLFNIAGFLVPDKSDVAHPSSSTQISDFSSHQPSNDYCMDKRLFTSVFSPDERAKHAYYCQRSQDEHIMQTILDIMTPDDIRTLTSCIDEDSRKGGFQRVFPTPSTHKYLRFFEQPRYYNLLLDQYIQRYNRMEQKGISMISSFCEEEEHLQNPTDNPSHQWNPPNATTLAYRDSRLYSAPVKPTDSKSSASNQMPIKMKKIPRVTPLRSMSQSPSTSTLLSSLQTSSSQSTSRIPDRNH